MALTEIQKAQVDKLLTAYCAKRVPAPVRPKIRVGYRIDRNAVILYEARPAFQPPHNWQEMVVAKFLYVGTRREWRRRAVEFRVRRLEDTLVDVPEKKGTAIMSGRTL